MQILSEKCETPRGRAPSRTDIEDAVKFIFGQDFGQGQVRQFHQLFVRLLAVFQANDRFRIRRCRLN